MVRPKVIRGQTWRYRRLHGREFTKEGGSVCDGGLVAQRRSGPRRSGVHGGSRGEMPGRGIS
ncbi:hypothetical protein E2562_027284 [Oryza meyeriana var. granulata]|uniref:Uncharacterized protein n=1 Tax=Oryza meyeriana var. granulata TaxID=110450 RepID=A0A6G1C9A3_9ORYZ|nr:hypothetical protein E2562_027284 [Oryza meyeriana var. granulata]